MEIIENVRTIQLLTREERFYEKYRESSHALKHTEVKNGFLDGVFSTFPVTHLFRYKFRCLPVVYLLFPPGGLRSLCLFHPSRLLPHR